MNYLKSYEELNSQGHLVEDYLYKTSTVKIIRNHQDRLYVDTKLPQFESEHSWQKDVTGTDNIAYAVAVFIDDSVKNDQGVLIGEDDKFRRIKLTENDKEKYSKSRYTKISFDDEDALSSNKYIFRDLSDIIYVVSGVNKRIAIKLLDDWVTSPTFHEYYKMYAISLMDAIEKCENLGQLYDMIKWYYDKLNGSLDEFIKKANITKKAKRFDL